VRIHTQQMEVIANADDYGDHGGPAEPSHGTRHHHRIDLASYRCVELLHGGKADEIEKIQQADPDDSEDEMKPAKDDELGRAATFRKTEVRSEEMESRDQRSL